MSSFSDQSWYTRFGAGPPSFPAPRNNPKVLRQYRVSRREWFREAIDSLKLELGCTDCGYNANPEALDFDHLEDKKMAVAHGTLASWPKVLNEMAKCEIVCANCHRIRTGQRRDILQ